MILAGCSNGATRDPNKQWSTSGAALTDSSHRTIAAKRAGAAFVRAGYAGGSPSAPSASLPAAAVLGDPGSSARVSIFPASTRIVKPTITWANPGDIRYGKALSSLQLDATAPVPGTFVYIPAAGTVLQAGLQTLGVIFTPQDTGSYAVAYKLVPIQVDQVVPTIDWPPLASIQEGTALGGRQLDATSNVFGTFTYHPGAGTVLAAGVQQLTVEFAPRDPTNYAAMTGKNSITVLGLTSTPPPPVGCGGPTVNLNSGMSMNELQSAISSAPYCALIVFAAGTYNTSSPLAIPCNSLTITGPAATPATAEITTGTANMSLTTMSGGCTSGTTTIEYLHFNGAGPLYVDANNYSNIVFSHNQVTSLPFAPNSYGVVSSLFLDGNNANTDSNITIEHNTFGDVNSCTAGRNQDDGSCAGAIFNTIAYLNNLTIRYNTFYHLNEGLHWLQVGYNSTPGAVAATCNNCDVEYNYFYDNVRIALENQHSVQSAPVTMSNNVFGNPSPTLTYSSMALSAACCLSGRVIADLTTIVPSDYVQNNVMFNNLNPVSQTPIGIELQGAPLASNNLIQGNFCNGFATGYNFSASIINNTIQGSYMSSGANCIFGSGGFFNTEEGQPEPTISGNVTGATPSAVTSIAPKISPASGVRTFPLSVVLTDAGYTSGPVPLGNTGIWYTTDGSTPVPGSGTAQYLATGGTFVLSAPATVKAVGMWGTPPQPTSYPAGYGFTPSSVVTAAYSASAAIKRNAGTASSSSSSTERLAAAAVGAATEVPVEAASATLQSVAITPSQPVVAIGSTIRLKAVATFGDGSVKDVTADFFWQSSDGRIVTANRSGMLAGVASGKAMISGSYQGLTASVSVNSTIGDVAWSDPIVITEGGTYSGNWQSTDARTPAVTVTTTAPVIIENAHIRSAGSLIKTTVVGSNLTVRNSLGVATSAAVKGVQNGVFLEVASPARLDVENNYIENAQGGVVVHGYAGNWDGRQTIVIRANRARNMNALLSDGNGGYLQGEAANRSQAHFIQFDSVRSVPGIDVGWNEVINYPGRSLVDDNIDLYRSGGTPNQPLELHDNYIQGAYPYKAAQDAYTGGGIKTDAKAGDNTQEVPAFNSIHDNQVVGTGVYGIQFAAGHDNVAANNRVISSGLLADGTKIAAQQVGMANGDVSGAANGSMYNNTMRDNVVGWMCWQSSCAQEGYRKDQFYPAAPADYSTNSVIAARQITFEMENNEYQVWLNKMASAGVDVGPNY